MKDSTAPRAPEPNYEKLTFRELDCLIASKVMHRTIKKNTRSIREYDGKRHDSGAWSWQSLPYYSYEDNAARRVRERIAELGMIRQYRHFLATLIWPNDTPFDQFNGADEFAFLFEQATPRQQCIAALKALDSQAGER